MKVQVTAVQVLPGESVGMGHGYPVSDMDVVDETKVVTFAGDWRAMVGLALMGMEADAAGEPLIVEIPDWSIQTITEL